MSVSAIESAAHKGVWEPIRYRFRHLPVHMALLHTGKILAFGGSGNDETNPTLYPAELWDPQTGAFQTIDQNIAGDVFCAGHAFLSDGRLVVAGGTAAYDGKLRVFGFNIPSFRGLNHTYAFDPIAEKWTREPNMATGRWYPTLVGLGDGRILAMAGLTGHFPWAFLRRVEVYSERGWNALTGAERWLPLYPRLHLLPNGDVFYSGSFNTHYTFPFTVRGFPTAILNVSTVTWRTIGPPNQTQREEGASILLPLTPPEYHASVLLVGGGPPRGTDAVSHAEVITLSDAHPTWKIVQPMKHARYHVYSVLLPDGQVLIVGGHHGTKIHQPPRDVGGLEAHLKAEKPDEPSVRPTPLEDLSLDHPEVPPQDPYAVREAEMFDPKTQTWSPMASMTVDRLYHSNALLLPDGRVMAAGSNPARRVNELRIEIYDPPYLFKGPRPVIEDAPEGISYGTDFEIRISSATQIDEVVLIRPSATTHGLDTDQRYVGLPIRAHSKATMTVEVPNNPNLVPPGYYMLFILRSGIPSVARFVRVDPRHIPVQLSA